MTTKKKTKKPITLKKPIAVEVCCSVVKSQQTYELTNLVRVSGFVASDCADRDHAVN